MTARSKFVFQTASPVSEQSVQNVVLVPQNPLEQIVVHIFDEFGCCQDIATAQSRVHTPEDNCRGTVGFIEFIVMTTGISYSSKGSNDGNRPMVLP